MRGGRSRGFTFIEIMVVVAIVGAMAALAGWNLQQQATRSRFRASVRDLSSLIREARANAMRVGSSLTTAGAVVNTNCPAFMVANPGLSIDSVTGVVTVLDRVTVAQVSVCDGATNRCAVTNTPCTVPTAAADCPPIPQHTLSCRQEPFAALYDNQVSFAPFVGAATASLTGTPAEIRIGFNSRGFLATANGPVGRVTMAEMRPGMVANQASLTVIVNVGGAICIEGLVGQCARQL